MKILKLILFNLFEFASFNVFMLMLIGVFTLQKWGFVLLLILGGLAVLWYTILFIKWAKKKNAVLRTRRSKRKKNYSTHIIPCNYQKINYVDKNSCVVILPESQTSGNLDRRC